ncbi:metal-sulfur cluster assembly factor [Corynebacterium sp. P7003]|uniref:Metal-sulfur cluster assembly factor n=1 Tax=Corynebacterium pygosceleis TaxID=2800406 RepID=A0ABT3WS24_9CORY|nr:metal-sulfur cluster assembly factor [Corynebacterium pygosceleis]MCX7443764.1 metal-sulfur cluster assembly factor [Corynebacterium pygosceleis]
MTEQPENPDAEVDAGTDTAGDTGERVRPEQSEADLAKASDVEEYMRDVIDPELGINVVDLGLVYDIWIENGDEAVVQMTLTSPACPLTDILEEQAETAVVGSGTASKLDLEWVWRPPWGPHMITEDGREQLRALGFSV